MIDFAKAAADNKEAVRTLDVIMSKKDDTFAQYEEIAKITNLAVAKVIITKLVEKCSRMN